MRIERTFDREFVNEVITHPRIYPHVSQDFAPAPAEFDCGPIMAVPDALFLVPMDGEERCGVFMVHPHSAIVHEVHTCILPQYWGRSVEAGRALIEWVFDNTKCLKLLTLVPDHNDLAYRLALKCGMVSQGTLTASYLKGGKLLDQRILAVSKAERRSTCR